MTKIIFVVYIVINNTEYAIRAFNTQEAAERYVENKKNNSTYGGEIYNIDILDLDNE